MTCHHPLLGTDDNRSLASGVDGTGVGRRRAGGVQIGRSAPPLFNLHAARTMFWDSRVAQRRDGTFELLVEASGPVSIAAQAVGYMPYRGTHALVLGSDLAIALEPATAVRLLVSPAMLSRELPPRVLARAGAQVVTEEPQLQPGTLPGTSLLELNQLGAGSWRVLLISSEGHARLDLTLPLADGLDAVPVALQPNGALEFQLGDITSSSNPARLALVVEPGVPIDQGLPLGIVDLSARVPPGGGLSRIFGGRLANGAFRMENLPAGNLLLQIRGENGQSVVLEVPFSVAPGATTELSLP